jgi:hypothetical protein
MHEDMLTREEVRAAIERQGCRRPPLMLRMWIGGDCYDAYGDALKEAAEATPEDVVQGWFRPPGDWEKPEDCPDYRWAIRDRPEDEDSLAIDARRFMPDWADLDEFLEKMPDPSRVEYFADVKRLRDENTDRFVAGCHFFCFYERLWTIRGMEALLLDMALCPDRVAKLADAIRDYHIKVIRGFAATGCDAFYTSDDLGTQAGLFFSPRTFQELLKPRYADLVDEAHGHGMQFWLHSCGDVTEIVEDLIEIGVEVLHPIQPFAMDPKATAERYGRRMTFMAGIDVQRLLPYGTAEEVVAGTREFVETFARPEGGFVPSMSNVVHTDVSLENLQAFLKTIYEYGAEYQARIRQ